MDTQQHPPETSNARADVVLGTPEAKVYDHELFPRYEQYPLPFIRTVTEQCTRGIGLPDSFVATDVSDRGLLFASSDPNWEPESKKLQDLSRSLQIMQIPGVREVQAIDTAVHLRFDLERLATSTIELITGFGPLYGCVNLGDGAPVVIGSNKSPSPYVKTVVPVSPVNQLPLQRIFEHCGYTVIQDKGFTSWMAQVALDGRATDNRVSEFLKEYMHVSGTSERVNADIDPGTTVNQGELGTYTNTLEKASVYLESGRTAKDDTDVNLKVETEYEKQLVLSLVMFPEIVKASCEAEDPGAITAYTESLSGTLDYAIEILEGSEYISTVRTNTARKLIGAATQVLDICVYLLGLTPATGVSKRTS